jgi:hypothetical protein
MRYLYLALAFLLTDLNAEDKSQVYEYRKYEKFDLGNLEVQGELMAPGDISVRERERERLVIDLFIRKQSQDFMKKDIESLH